MKIKPQVVVVGLGRFGKSFASKMYNLGHDVMAIDIDPDKVQSMVGQVTYPVTTDASSELSLRELGVQDFDVGVVALADVEVSIMVSVLFKTLNINNIIARASSDLHKDTLIRLGCDRVVFAEDEMGEQLAKSILASGVLDQVVLSTGQAVAHIHPQPELIGKTLREAGLYERHGIMVIGIEHPKRRVDDKGELHEELILDSVPRLDTIIRDEDVLVVVGEQSNIEAVASRE